MSIFKRIRDISLAGIHDLLDKAEDPVSLLNQYVRDMEEEVAEAEAAVAKQIAVEKKLQHQFEEAMDLVNKRGEQAVKALEAGNEDLARRTLKDKKEQQEKANQYRTQYEQAKANVDQLRSQMKEMAEQLAQMKRNKDVLIARAETAKVQKQMNQAMGGIGGDKATTGFERMSGKVRQLEAEAEASAIVRKERGSLEQELRALDQDEDVEEELARLKEQLADKKSGS